MDRLPMSVFFIAFMLCGASMDKFFEGGAPVAIVAAVVAIACAMVMCGKEGGDNGPNH